jgi:hypothetical protein
MRKTHFLGPLDHGVRNHAVDANHCQQKCESGKNPNRGSVKLRADEELIQPLLHGFHAEYGNLRVRRLDGVADHSQVIFRPAVHASHKRREETAWSRRRDKDLIPIHVCRIGLVLHSLDDANNVPRGISLDRELMMQGVVRRAKSRGKFRPLHAEQCCSVFSEVHRYCQTLLCFFLGYGLVPA